MTIALLDHFADPDDAASDSSSPTGKYTTWFRSHGTVLQVISFESDDMRAGALRSNSAMHRRLCRMGRVYAAAAESEAGGRRLDGNIPWKVCLHLDSAQR